MRYALSLSHVRLCDCINCSPSGSSVNGTFRQKSWSGLPSPLGDLPELGSNPHLLHFLHICIIYRYIYYYFNHYPVQNSFSKLPSLLTLTQIPEKGSHAWLLWRLQEGVKIRMSKLTGTGQWVGNWIPGYSYCSADSSCHCQHSVW